jgi:hypothetical protein
MFPTMRLFLGALLASIVVLCCGFCVFAAFRVNHDPLSRLPAETVTLQLIASETAGPPPAWHAPVRSRFEAREAVSDARIGGVPTDAPVLLPISRVTIQPASLRTISAVGPEAAIDASQESVPPPHESPPLGLPAAAALSAPALATAPIASGSPQPAPPAQIATDLVPADSAPAASPASMPTVAAVEPPSNAIASASGPADIAGIPLQVAVPEPKARPTPASDAAQRALRREGRQALLRRRLAARRRIAANTAASTQSANPFFQSAPGAFQQPAAGRGAARKSANAAGTTGNAPAWPSSQ